MPTIDPQGLRQVANGFTTVEHTLEQAKTAFASGPPQEILSGNFTNVHVALASVYVEAYNFALRDLQTKAQDAAEFHDRLDTTADHWDTADHHSTVKGH